MKESILGIKLPEFAKEMNLKMILFRELKKMILTMEYINIEYFEIVGQTEKAISFHFNDNQFWCPKSIIKNGIPTWFLKSKIKFFK